MQCNFCYKEITEGGFVWLNKKWCMISHAGLYADAGLPHICDKYTITLSKKEIMQELMKQHPAHKLAVESIIAYASPAQRKQRMDIAGGVLVNAEIAKSGKSESGFAEQPHTQEHKRRSELAITPCHEGSNH